jgi:hypothetical protein
MAFQIRVFKRVWGKKKKKKKEPIKEMENIQK